MCTFHAKREGLGDRVGRTAVCLPFGSHINSALFGVDRCQDAHIIVCFQYTPQPGDKDSGRHLLHNCTHLPQEPRGDCMGGEIQFVTVGVGMDRC